MLYDQLCFYKHIFDLSRRPKSDKHWSRDLDVERLHDKMTEFMNTKLESSAYGHIDLHKLFSKIVLPGTVLSTATRG
ncbi:hypothetical protein EB796_016207 [Bugula neritina]|uniref:Uncharacterized protein n=1 Tax=Bugula neritina TaxID=10212 RepID=A0A7J7JI35_BUGNE|nr:hypothetical protein EB796_016207 [Bugula neritina]